MDDGGIELNFAAPSALGARIQVNKKGGRWTDRVKAKQAVRRETNKIGRVVQEQQQQQTGVPSKTIQRPRPVEVSAPSASTPAPTTTRPTPRPAAAPAPAPRISSTHAPRPTRADPSSEAGPSRLPSTTSLPSPPLPRKAAPPSKTTLSAPTSHPSQVISSLFTSNPSLPRPSLASRAAAIGAPSNAPLASETNTFAGLGLDPLLVRHLKNKMGVENPTGIQKSSLPFMLSEPLDIDAKPEDEDEDDAYRESDSEDGYDEGPEETEEVQEVEEVKVSSVKGKEKESPLRDVFIQSQTGSGKTLTYLLPIVQTLLPLSQLSYIDRSIGTLAIILAPTRELAQQISQVLETLLTMSLSLPDSESGSALQPDRSFTRWLVSGLLVGGSTRTHEKAKLRKGVPILVSTPGRLLDHLQNTSSFKCAKTLFFVLDEADRLMDLGFEETIQGIIKALDGRRRNEMNVEKEMDQEGGGTMRWPYWARGRRTILCSATIDAKVERLAGGALQEPVVFRSTEATKIDKASKTQASQASEAKSNGDVADSEDAVASALKQASAVVLPEQSDKFTPPSQLAQKYIVAPTKLRLVTLVALLRSLVAPSAKPTPVGDEKQGVKVIVFLSSTDSVDFHWKLLGGVSMGEQNEAEGEEENEDGGDGEEEDGGKESVEEEQPDEAAKSKPKAKSNKASEDIVALKSALFANTTIHRLHGSLPLRTRLASLKAFSTPSPDPSILLATSVASRGLDLPLVRAVVQYDLPTEGGANEYVHRVGRTARAGKGGEAWAFVAPPEVEWVKWVEEKMGAAVGEVGVKAGEQGAVRLGQVGVDAVLRNGFGGRGHEYEARATDVQLAFERWVLSQDQNASLARKAFASFVRAYSTHPLEERRFFHVKTIHLGHLAKSFALREAPGSLAATTKPSKSKTTKANSAGGKRKRTGYGSDAESDDEEYEDAGGKKKGKESTARNETERRMYEAVRRAGRLVKSGGAMGEFAPKSGGPGAGKGSGGKQGAGKGMAAGGGGEFHVMDTSDLEKMVRGKL